MTGKVVRWLSAAAMSSMLIVGAASPANAEVSSGDLSNFWYTCDASVYITDNLVGSPGKIEAWGGFSCYQQYWGGVMRLQIKRNGTKVADVWKAVAGGSAMTGHIDATVSNVSGAQDWQAILLLSRPGVDTWVVSTGVIRS